MKGVHKSNQVNVGNVEMQKAAFQQAKAKKASLAKAAEETLKFNKLVDGSKKKVAGKQEGGGGAKRDGNQGRDEKPENFLGNGPIDEDEEGPSFRKSLRIDIRI
jgi:hypothetical protein